TAAPSGDRLESLDLLGSTRYDYNGVVGALRLPRLRSLSLSGETLDAWAATALLDSPHLPELAALDLSFSGSRWRTPPQDDGMLQALLQAAAWPRLESLTLRNAEVTKAGARDLAASAAKLRRLDLFGNPLGPEGIRHLAEAPWLSSVWLLILSSTGANDDSIAA